MKMPAMRISVGDRYAAWLDVEISIAEKPDLMQPV
jgi:hypothetical protein